MGEIYFKQPNLSAEQASKMMEKHLLGQGKKVNRLSPFKIRVSTGHFLWKANVDLEFSKKEDHIVITINRNLFSGSMKSLVSVVRSGDLDEDLKNAARFLFEEPVINN